MEDSYPTCSGSQGLGRISRGDPPTETTALPGWKKKDKKARAVIGLTLSNDMLENVREATSAKAMWTSIKNVFERHTLLNKLSARRKFYTASMEENEGILKFANRIRQLSSVLKSHGRRDIRE